MMVRTWLREIVHELDHQHIPVQNVERIMRHVLDAGLKIEREAKALIQECASEFIGLVTDDAKVFMQAGSRKTITGPDVVLALEDLWFKPYADLVRQFQWPETSEVEPGASRRKRKRCERPPLPLDQQRFAGGPILKRCRGGGRSSSSSSPSSSSSWSSLAGGIPELHLDEHEALSVRFARVLTVNDLILPAPIRHGYTATSQSSSSSSSSSSWPTRMRTFPTRHMTAAVDHRSGNVMSPLSAGNIASPIALLDDDGASCLMAMPPVGNVTTAAVTSPVGEVNLILGRYAGVPDGMMMMMATPVVQQQQQQQRPRSKWLGRHDDEPRPAPELKSVLGSPKLRSFPKPDAVRTTSMSVRSVNPFSLDVTNQFGLDLDSLSGNASLALDIAFSQLTESTTSKQ